MRYLRTKGGEVAESQILRVRRDGDQVQIECRDVSPVMIHRDDWEGFRASAFQTVIPAEPGTRFLTPVDDGDKVEWTFEAVVGWAVRDDGMVRAVGVDQIDDMDRPIVHPDGKVSTRHNGMFDTVDAYLASSAAEAAAL